MKKELLVRSLSVGFISLIVALIGAKVPSFDSGANGFSVPGFFVGFLMPIVAYSIAALLFDLLPDQAPGSPQQQRVTYLALIFLLAALLAFVCFLYAKIELFRAVLILFVALGAGAVAVGVLVTWSKK